MGHSNLIFVIGVGLAIAGLTVGAAINMRKNAEGPEIASEYRVAREAAISGLELSKAQLADDFYLWFTGFTLSKPAAGGEFTATVTFVDTLRVQIRSTGSYARGRYLVIGEYVGKVSNPDFEKGTKVQICHITGSCASNPDETITVDWNAWEGGPKHSQHCMTCLDADGNPLPERCDSIGPCGEKVEWQNVTGITLLNYSEWRLPN